MKNFKQLSLAFFLLFLISQNISAQSTEFKLMDAYAPVFKAKINKLKSDTILITKSFSGAKINLPVENIDHLTMWEKPKSRKKGVIMGSVIGGTIGLLAGYLLPKFNPSESVFDPRTLVYPCAIGAAGTLIGGIIGANTVKGVQVNIPIEGKKSNYASQKATIERLSFTN